jgi:RNA recognition motif-containing protein
LFFLAKKIGNFILRIQHRQELLNYQQHQASAHDLSEHQHDKQSTSSKQHSHQKNTDKDSNLNNDSTFEFCSVFIGDIDSSINEDDLKKAFEFCGKIHSVSIIRDRMGRSKSYGFVNFFTPEAQDRAVDESHKISIKVTHLSELFSFTSL